MRRFTPYFVKRVLILNSISEGLPSGRFWVVMQSVHSFALGGDVTLVPQLVLPLIVGLRNYCTAQ